MGHFDPPRAFFLDNFERGGDFSTKFLAIPSLQLKTFGYMKNSLIRPYILGGEDHIEGSNFGSKTEFFSIFPKVLSSMQGSSGITRIFVPEGKG